MGSRLFSVSVHSIKGRIAFVCLYNESLTLITLLYTRTSMDCKCDHIVQIDVHDRIGGRTSCGECLDVVMQDYENLSDKVQIPGSFAGRRTRIRSVDTLTIIHDGPIQFQGHGDLIGVVLVNRMREIWDIGCDRGGDYVRGGIALERTFGVVGRIESARAIDSRSAVKTHRSL